MTNALTRLMDALANALETLPNENAKNDGVGPTLTISITNSENGAGPRFTIGQNTSLTDMENLGPILAALVSRAANLRNGNNQDASIQFEVLSGSSGEQAGRRTVFTIQRSTLPPAKDSESDSELSLTPETKDNGPENTKVHGILSRLLRSLRNRAE